MNYLKLVIKTTCIARHLSDHAILLPHVKRFSPAGSRQLEIDGDTSPPSSAFQQFFRVFAALLYRWKNCRILFLLNRLNF
jgi:hypothetical protein